MKEAWAREIQLLLLSEDEAAASITSLELISLRSFFLWVWNLVVSHMTMEIIFQTSNGAFGGGRTGLAWRRHIIRHAKPKRPSCERELPFLRALIGAMIIT